MKIDRTNYALANKNKTLVVGDLWVTPHLTWLLQSIDEGRFKDMGHGWNWISITGNEEPCDGISLTLNSYEVGSFMTNGELYTQAKLATIEITGSRYQGLYERWNDNTSRPTWYVACSSEAVAKAAVEAITSQKDANLRNVELVEQISEVKNYLTNIREFCRKNKDQNDKIDFIGSWLEEALGKVK